MAAELETRKAEVARLRKLSDKAEAGERGARAELRRAVAECSPAVIAEASDIARRAQKGLVKTIAGGEPLMEEALEARLTLMRAEVVGQDPTPLEQLLGERVVAGWLLVEVLEGLIAAQFQRGKPRSASVSPSYLIQMSRILESATKRYLRAIRELARVRKLEASTPGIYRFADPSVTGVRNPS